MKESTAKLEILPKQNSKLDYVQQNRDLIERVARISMPSIATMEVPIVGTTPLITNAKSSEFAKNFEDIYITKIKVAGRGRNTPARDPNKEWEGSLHVIDKANEIYGFPTIAFKECIVLAIYRAAGIYPAQARSLFHIEAQYAHEDSTIKELVKIDYRDIVLRKDYVNRNSKGKKPSPSFAYRCQFVDWSTILKVKFNMTIIPQDRLLAFIVMAGHIGIGAWSTLKEGDFGQFRIPFEKGENGNPLVISAIIESDAFLFETFNPASKKDKKE